MAFWKDKKNLVVCHIYRMRAFFLPMKVETGCLHFTLLNITKSQQGRTDIVVFAETKILVACFVLLFELNVIIYRVTLCIILLRMNLFFAQTSNNGSTLGYLCL